MLVCMVAFVIAITMLGKGAASKPLQTAVGVTSILKPIRSRRCVKARSIESGLFVLLS